jgi:hypothetical protein
MSYVVATITRGDPRMEFVQAMHDLMGSYSYWMMQPGGHYLDDARNQCVDRFLHTGDEDWLLFIDDDQSSFTGDMIDTLFAKVTDQHRCVCGWYLSTLNDGVGPVVFDWGPHEKFGEHFTQIGVSDIRERERDDYGYLPVASAGTGFMALHRTLIEELVNCFPYPTSPFAEEVINGVHCGEDLTICHRITALGHQVYIHPDVHVGHVKTLELKEQL